MNWFYNSRESRSRWLAERFQEEIAQSESVLDVGCHKRDFQKYISETKKFGFVTAAEESERQYQKPSLRKSILGIFGMLNKNFINRHYICLLKKGNL